VTLLRRALVLLAVVPVVLSALAEAGSKMRLGGYRKDYRNGYAIRVPQKWSRVPPKTWESLEVGNWYGTSQTRLRPQLLVVRIDRSPREEIPEELRPSHPRGAPKTVEGWLDVWLDRHGGHARVDYDKPLKIGGEQGRVWFCVTTDPAGELCMLLASVKKDGVEFGIVLCAHRADFDREREALYSVIHSFRFLRVRSEKDVDYDEAFETERVEARKAAEKARWLAEVKSRIDNVKEWGHYSTANYLVLFDRKVKAVDVKRVAVHIESIRRDVYSKLFPPTRPITAISVVRVCKDEEQYIAYGGSAGSAGYWSPKENELVFFFEDKDAIRVLYHEAFHQYIHHAFGELAPHIWFNEGHGDYFAGFEYRGRFVPGRFTWRRKPIRDAIAAGSTVPLAKFLRYTRAQYYSSPSLCYAQGWALIFYLRHTRKAGYRKILPTYFEALKRELGALRKKDHGAMRKALDKALEEAFEGIDLDKLEADWKRFRY
jgi:hypothetical protein